MKIRSADIALGPYSLSRKVYLCSHVPFWFRGRASAATAHMGSARDTSDHHMRQMMEEYQRKLQEGEMRLNEMEQKLKETTEQNVIMAHALVSTCK